ncbi:hypothetical protein WA158_004591 [Blastocystis sp. Blastoise]
MAYIYNLEPFTEGKVILHTDKGDVTIELWPKQSPLAVRNFVQLCLEGYYDNTIFHRIIKGMMVQGGDPTGTGAGGESIYDGPFKDEFNQRLKFSHRGIVAMANSNIPNTNQSQFFITLDKTEWLTGKHTIFGRVNDDTIYNILRMADLEIGKEDRPVYPPKIINVTVVDNPFPDIVPRVIKKKEDGVKKDKEKTKKVKKAVKNLKLLSFGEDEEELNSIVQKKNLKNSVIPEDIAVQESLEREKEQLEKEEKKRKEIEEQKKMDIPKTSDESTTKTEPKDYEEKMIEKMKEKEKKFQEKKKLEEEKKKQKDLEEAVKKQLKSRKNDLNDDSKIIVKPKIDIENAKNTVLDPSSYKRKVAIQKKEILQKQQVSTSDLLKQFKNRLKSAWKEKKEPEKKEDDEDKDIDKKTNIKNKRNIDDDDESDDDVNDNSWMTSQLRFTHHIDDELRMGFEPRGDDYLTLDPRLESKDPIKKEYTHDRDHEYSHHSHSHHSDSRHSYKHRH